MHAQNQNTSRNTWPSRTDEVDHLILNARLRDELEPFFDESLEQVDLDQMPTPVENEYLASMLAWERAPVLPISQWFEPELRPPHPSQLDESALRETLWEIIEQLHEKKVVLEFTDHLSDRELYCLLYRDILPAAEKKLDAPQQPLRWRCLDIEADPENWLRYYANDEERWEWEEANDLEAPAPKTPPHPRTLPGF